MHVSVKNEDEKMSTRNPMVRPRTQECGSGCERNMHVSVKNEVAEDVNAESDGAKHELTSGETTAMSDRMKRLIRRTSDRQVVVVEPFSGRAQTWWRWRGRWWSPSRGGQAVWKGNGGGALHGKGADEEGGGEEREGHHGVAADPE